MTKKIILIVLAIVIFTLLIVGGGLFYGYKSGLFNKFLGNAVPATVASEPLPSTPGLTITPITTEPVIPEVVETPPVETVPVVDETEIVKNAMIVELTKENGDLGDSTVTVSKIEGDFARGGVGGQGGGGMWFAAKVGGVWKLVWAGNGIIYCEDLAAYPDLPTSFIPECYDKKTDSLVTR